MSITSIGSKITLPPASLTFVAVALAAWFVLRRLGVSRLVAAVVAMLDEGHVRSAADVREAMSGNLCRCGAYPNIVAAIRQAMEQS